MSEAHHDRGAPEIDDPDGEIRRANRTFRSAVGISALFALSLTVAVTALEISSTKGRLSLTDALPRLGLGDALTLITAFLVVFGLGTLGSQAGARRGDAGVRASMDDQRLREIAVIGGWCGFTVALWAMIDAFLSWLSRGTAPGEAVGSVLAALMAGLLTAALGSLVNAQYPADVRDRIDARRRMNEAEIRARLTLWSVPRAVLDARLDGRVEGGWRLALPVVAQVSATSALAIGVVILAGGPPVETLRFGLWGLVITLCTAALSLEAVASFRAIPRAQLLGTVAGFTAALFLMAYLFVAVLTLRDTVASRLLWWAPALAVAVRFWVGHCVRTAVPAVAPGWRSIVDRRWWVVAVMVTSQHPRLALRPTKQTVANAADASTPGYL